MADSSKVNPLETKELSGSAAVFEVFITALKLGLTSFGGPIAHLGYFYNEYVKRKNWLTDKAYTELVAISQLLPGPASSQFGMAVGTMRAGIAGGIASWIGFTLPSALIMISFALFIQGAGIDPAAGWLQGLKITAVAIVADAVLQMGKKLAAGPLRALIAVLSAVVALLWDMASGHIIIIIAAGIAGVFLFKNNEIDDGPGLKTEGGIRTSTVLLTVFFLLLIIFPVLRYVTENYWISLADSMYRAGALVFGGGHVILPLLEREFVATGWVSAQEFLAGYGAAQALPGPLFTFSAYLGFVSGGINGALTALAAIFLPGFLLITGVVPLWKKIRSVPQVGGAVTGINAAVVGILLAALYNPLWTSSIKSPAAFSLAVVLYAMLSLWKLPVWSVVIAGAAGGWLIGFF